MDSETKASFYESLIYGLRQGILSVSDMTDMLDQFEYYWANQASIDSTYPGLYVAIANLTVYSATTVVTAEANASAGAPGRMIYAIGISPVALRA